VAALQVSLHIMPMHLRSAVKPTAHTFRQGPHSGAAPMEPDTSTGAAVEGTWHSESMDPLAMAADAA
jgi:hypothetical protein